MILMNFLVPRNVAVLETVPISDLKSDLSVPADFEFFDTVEPVDADEE